MNVEVGPKVFRRHGRAFDMPSWASFTPGAFPPPTVLGASFPEGKVQRVLFGLGNLDPSSGEQVVEVSAGQFAVVGETPHREVDVFSDVGIDDIAVAFVDDLLH